MILCLGTTPATQRVMKLRQLTIDVVNRALATLEGVAGKSVNVVKVLKALGEEPVALGFVGGDRGAYLRGVLVERGIEVDFVSVAPRTRECITVIDQSNGTITELVEESREVAPADYDELLARFRRRVKRSRAVVMSGSITPGGPADLYRLGTELAHEAGALSVVDAQGPPLLTALPAKPGLVKPNRAELAATAGRPLLEETDVLSAMRELHGRGAQRVVVTAGAAPVLAFDGRSFWRIHSPRITVANPIGSGDAFTAGLVWRLLQGEDLGEAGRWGAAAGAANALTFMPGDLDKADVDRLVREVVVENVKA